MKQYYTYMLMNQNKSVIYTGVTGNLIKRIFEHKNKIFDGFTKKYNVDMLVYYEIYNDVDEAIKREKQIKNWHRDWKLNLIKGSNPEFKDLYDELVEF
ncbi:MAG: GIY-YIG nuclease family protein [Alphaproteobacteria bacterium]|nr:GIY-YIG nuclease family protein [Alphaproteobacteria bacterium]